MSSFFSQDNNNQSNQKKDEQSSFLVQSSSFNEQYDANQNPTDYIKTYSSSSSLFGLSFQSNQPQIRMITSSMKISNENSIELIEYTNDSDIIVKKASIDCFYPCTKVMFSPEEQNKNLFISTSDNLHVYQYNDTENSISLNTTLTKNNVIYCGPLTSCDWSIANYAIVGVSSIDTTCTIWDLNKKETKQQFIAQTKEVFDISLGPNEFVFMSAGGEGRINLFDTRTKAICNIIFETGDRKAITILNWNLRDPNFLLAVGQDKSTIYIIDQRNNEAPFDVLKGHNGVVNNAIWQPGSSSHLISVSDDKSALVWDIKNEENGTAKAIMSYMSKGKLENVAWGTETDDWVGVVYDNNVEMLKIK